MAQILKNDNPNVLELGCGRGEYTVALAQLFPEKNFIGVDIKGSRMWAGAKESHLKGLKNVAFIRTNIEIISEFFATDEVSEIWLTFPDPQMKKVRKRLTSTRFMELYQQFVNLTYLIYMRTLKTYHNHFLLTISKSVEKCLYFYHQCI
jgi:tRNA (guanine-N7-)-methyltransferase